MKKLVFLSLITFVVLFGNACRDNVQWPVIKPQPEQSVSIVPESIAVYSIMGNAQQSMTSYSSIPGKNIVTKNYFTVNFIVYNALNINDTTPIYTSTYTDTLKQNYTTSNPFQAIIPISYTGCIERCEFVVTKVQEIITPKYIGRPATLTNIITYIKTQVGGEANGSGKCEPFNQGTIGNTQYMIFSQTGSAVIQ